MARKVKYLLVGGGVACVAASMAIRERDKEGSCTIVCGEPHMPYDRPPLSKGYLTNLEMTPDDASSKFDNYYPDNGIEVLRGLTADQLNLSERKITLSNGDELEYEKLLLATGARPKPVPASGEINNVHLLRTVDDSSRIRDSFQTASTALMIGTGYIGMEVCSQMLKQGLETTLLSKDAHPWARFASPELGQFIADYARSKGATVLHHEEVVAILEGPVAVTGSGMKLPADVIVAGLGVDLNTELASQAGLRVTPDEGVSCDEYLRTSDENVYVAGDIANFRDLAMNKQWHIEHFLNARWQGSAAGANMAGANEPYNRVPYFFSDLFDLHMILRGDPSAGRNTKLLGDLAGAEFVELYHDDGGYLTMGVAISREEPKLDPISDKLEELIRAKAQVNDLDAATFGLP
jgi:3-phenylpropionate/trans-cinnamate dioxygenase ferredoxin reductase component